MPRGIDPAALKQRIREICEIRVRQRYSRMHYVLRREGWQINVKKICREHREMGLQLRNKTGYKSSASILSETG